MTAACRGWLWVLLYPAFVGSALTFVLLSWPIRRMQVTRTMLIPWSTLIAVWRRWWGSGWGGACWRGGRDPGGAGGGGAGGAAGRGFAGCRGLLSAQEAVVSSYSPHGPSVQPVSE
ncbi:MAG: hypothetical protein OER90_06585 [Gemmatimonadota bacterium]|nr:hypothetical protein [Gemmatimonadota bacterium]